MRVGAEIGDLDAVAGDKAVEGVATKPGDGADHPVVATVQLIGVTAGAARQGVGAIAATVKHVGAVIPDQDVVVGVAGGVDVARAGEAQDFDIGRRQRVG